MFGNLSLKESIIRAIQGLPDDCTLEDILNEITSMGKLLESFNDIERGQFITTEELIDRIDKKGH